jgi:hypothetical protein
MQLRRELVWTLGSLALINLLLAFGAIGLFVRMGPAIQRILDQNVYSIVAAEEILAELAYAGSMPVPPAGRDKIRAAIIRSKHGVTEGEEGPLLQSIERWLAAATDGDPEARARVVADIQHLIRVNRDAMKAVDIEAQRLGNAGAWGAVLMGFLSFLLSVFVFVHLRRRVLNPLLELVAVLEATGQGARLRRCRIREAPLELTRSAELINQLLDERLARTAREPPE